MPYVLWSVSLPGLQGAQMAGLCVCLLSSVATVPRSALGAWQVVSKHGHAGGGSSSILSLLSALIRVIAI